MIPSFLLYYLFAFERPRLSLNKHLTSIRVNHVPSFTGEKVIFSSSQTFGINDLAIFMPLKNFIKSQGAFFKFKPVTSILLGGKIKSRKC